MKIKDVGKTIKGRTPPTDKTEYWDGDIPFVTTKDLQSGKYIHSTERTVTSNGLQLYPKNIVPPNAVCVSCTGNLGYVGITTKPCLTNQQILAIVPGKENDPEYIYYLMKSMWGYFKQIEGHSTVTSQINKERFSDIEINVPDLSVQREIAETLRPFDELLEINAQKENNLRKQLKLIFRHYTSTADESIPLCDLCTVKNGTYQIDQSDENNVDGNIRWLCAQDISGTFVSETSRTISGEVLSVSNGKQETFPTGTIVISIVGTIGQTAITTVPMCANSAIAFITPNDTKMTDFLYTYLMCQYEHLNQIASGSVLKRINVNTLKALPVPMPSEKELQLIIDDIRLYFAQLRLIHEENTVLTQTQDIAVSKLFAGTLL